MAELVKILNQSFKMLFERPQLFVPRLASATISSLLLIGFVAGWITPLHFIAAFPIIAIIGAFTPVMVSAMVDTEGKSVLKTGLKKSLRLWRSVAGLTLFTVFLGFLNSLPLGLGFIATYATGNIIYLGIGGILSFLMLLAITFGLYFVPISIVKNKSFFRSLEDGFSTSRHNSKEVVALTLFSFAVLGASSIVTGQLRNIGFTVFFVGRIASSIVGTYLLVISPKYYLEEKS